MDDLKKMLPVGFCAMGAHCFSVFALSAGAVSFGQIVKAVRSPARSNDGRKTIGS